MAASRARSCGARCWRRSSSWPCSSSSGPLPPDRRRLLRLQLERTRLACGRWALHPEGQPSLFVTTLVYVAARLLGEAPDSPLLAPAGAFIRAQGGARAVPSWGKLWLALLGLYDWQGLHPVLPEAWALPRRSALHPRNLYCHTRMIYLPMAVLFAERPRAAMTPTLLALRAELHPGGQDLARLGSARSLVAPADLVARPTRRFRALSAASALVERLHHPTARRRLVASLRARVRAELHATAHHGISPVSGLLDILALHVASPTDPDVATAVARLERWIREDEVDGTRVTGAQSAVWDTSFALQALALARDASVPAASVGPALERGAAWLAAQQVRAACPDLDRADRLDPRGGFLLRRPMAGLAGERLHGRGAAGAPGGPSPAARSRHTRRSRGGHRLRADHPESRRRLRELRGRSRPPRPRLDEPGGDVRRRHDRPLLGRVHGLVHRRACRRPRGRGGRWRRAGPGPGERRPLAEARSAARRRLGGSLGCAPGLRHPLRRSRPPIGGAATHRPGRPSRLCVSARPPACRRRLRRAQRAPRGRLGRGRCRPPRPDRLGPHGARRGPRPRPRRAGPRRPTASQPSRAPTALGRAPRASACSSRRRSWTTRSTPPSSR
jgi:hypothetical protein